MPDYSDDPERAAEEHEDCARKFATLKRELADAMFVVNLARRWRDDPTKFNLQLRDVVDIYEHCVLTTSMPQSMLRQSRSTR